MFIALLGWSIVFIASLVLLIKSADYFTKYAEKLGVMLGLNSFIIGATIVAVGTSLPELISSSFAVVLNGNTEFVVDNIVGSNIANSLLILGIGAIVAKNLKVTSSLVDVDLPFFFTSMAIFIYFAWDLNISIAEALFLLGFFIIFTIYSVTAGDTHEDKEELIDIKEKVEASEYKNRSVTTLKYLGFIIVSMAGVAFGAKYFIDSLLEISSLLSISSTILTLTVVALGTSLPEIFTSIAAIKQGNHAIAIGNVFGSNTFNLTLVAGLPALLAGSGGLSVDTNTLFTAMPFLVISTLMVIFITLDDKIKIWEGVSLLFVYLIFMSAILGVLN